LNLVNHTVSVQIVDVFFPEIPPFYFFPTHMQTFTSHPHVMHLVKRKVISVMHTNVKLFKKKNYF